MNYLQVVVILFLLLVLSLYVYCNWIRPPLTGIQGGMFQRCPSSPNCVNSQTGTGFHQIDPIPWDQDTSPIRRISEIINEMPRTTILIQNNEYLYVTFTSPYLRFIDDVEFYWDHDAKVIHVHSASRCGKGDFGVNRKRVEQIREKFVGR